MDIKTITEELESITDPRDLEDIYSIIASYTGYSKALEKYNEYRANMTEEQYNLMISCIEYEFDYFKDMILSEDSIMGDISEIALEIYDCIPLGIEYANLRFYIVDSNEFDGCFYQTETKIEIIPKYKSDKSIILHELIHFYECQLTRYFPAAAELLILRLYKELSSKIEDLDDLIRDHCDAAFQDVTFSKKNAGKHGLLFYLKSLDLDLRCGYELNTIRGYNDDENAK